MTRQIRERVTGWGLQPIGGWLYGSAARGDGDRDSDVDLFFVLANGYDHDTWELQTAELIDYVNRCTGNWVQILPHTLGSFMDLERSGSVFPRTCEWTASIWWMGRGGVSPRRRVGVQYERAEGDRHEALFGRGCPREAGFRPSVLGRVRRA